MDSDIHEIKTHHSRTEKVSYSKHEIVKPPAVFQAEEDMDTD